MPYSIYMDALISAVISWLLSFLLLYGYAALFVVAFFAAAIAPLPSSTLLVAASAFSSVGYLNIYLVFATSLAGNVLGDLTGYLILNRYGKKALTTIGLRRLVYSKRFESLESYFRAYPRTLIFFSRFMTEVNALVNFLSGISDVPFRTFITFELIGQTFYVLVYSTAGYYLGSSWEDHVDVLKWGALGIFTVGVITNLVQSRLYKRRKRAT